ncbi:hypothetical protein VCHENC02_3838B, partial [Vibrio harveyi]
NKNAEVMQFTLTFILGNREVVMR